METIFSFLEFELLAIITLGTLHPKPVIKLTTLLPLKPKCSNVRSNKADNLEITPLCWIKFTKVKRIIIVGKKVNTAKKPPNIPLTNKSVVHSLA